MMATTSDLVHATQQLQQTITDVLGYQTDQIRVETLLNLVDQVVHEATQNIRTLTINLSSLAELAAARAEIDLLTSELTAQRKRIQALESAMTVEKSVP